MRKCEAKGCCEDAARIVVDEGEIDDVILLCVGCALALAFLALGTDRCLSFVMLPSAERGAS